MSAQDAKVGTGPSELSEHFDLGSEDPAARRRQMLLRLFPEVATEGGKVDFDQLKRVLGEQIDAGKERYGMVWPGRAECFKVIQAPSLGTLRPIPSESINFDTTANLIIEGDNLEVLKLLQKSYLGKVKMIYIDPPYNTGNDFIYPDDYSESLQTYLEYTGQVDGAGKKFSTNTDADGRFHSKWLNMMYPRLYLARNLLREDGVIFMSVDDTEVANARNLLNQIFGEDNFVATVVWQKVYSPRMDDAGISVEHDFVLVYGASREFLPRRMPFKQNEKQFTGIDKTSGKNYRPRSLRKEGKNSRRIDRPNLFYALAAPNGDEVYPIRSDGTEGCWRMGKAKYERLVAEGLIEWSRLASGWQPFVKQFYDPQSTRPYMTIWTHTDVGHSHGGADELKRLLGDAVFNSPKPSSLIVRMLEIATGDAVDGEDPEEEPEIVLDFFAGSGTTGQAVLDLNERDDVKRQFILVQLPEPTERKDYPTIADITKERVRRVIKNLGDGDTNKLNLKKPTERDRGFRVFKLAESNFKTWAADASADEVTLEQQLELHVDHIRKSRTDQDLLYELLLRSGFPLSTPVETLSLDGKTAYSVASGALLICLEREPTLELVRAMAETKPERVVMLDEGFAGNDQLKTNSVQIFKTKGVPSFKTV